MLIALVFILFSRIMLFVTVVYIRNNLDFLLSSCVAIHTTEHSISLLVYIIDPKPVDLGAGVNHIA